MNLVYARYFRPLCCGLVMLMLTSCAPPLVNHAQVRYAEEAANVYVTAYNPIPWSDISDKLDPKHNLSMTEARSLAFQTTQSQVFQFLSTLSAGLTLGLPTKTQNLTTTVTEDGVESTTGTSTQNYGAVPSSSGVTSSSVTSVGLPPIPSAGVPLGVDGNSLLTAATGLYQQAQILDNQISKGVFSPDYQINLITFQVNVQPKRRDVSYDAYVDLTLMPQIWSDSTLDEKGAAKPPVIIYPLIIMDAMETSNVTRAVEIINQLSLALNGMIGNIGAAAGASGGTGQLSNTIGLDKNSLVTVGKVADHTVRIRLGAENSGSARLALVPRVFNVSLVVMTRWEDEKTEGDTVPAPAPKRIRALEAVTHTTLVSTEDGTDLSPGPTRERKVMASKVADRLCYYNRSRVDAACAGYPQLEDDKLGPCPEHQQNNNFQTLSDFWIDANLELLTAVNRSDYAHINTCLRSSTLLEDHNSIKLKRLFSELVGVQADSRYSRFFISMPDRPDPELPPKQVAIYSDDEKQTSFVVRGGKGLNPKKLQATIHFKAIPAKKLLSDFELYPNDILMTGDGSQITVNFPSMTQLGLQPENFDVRPLSLMISSATSSRYEVMSRYEVIKREAKPAQESIKNPVSSSSAVLIADQNSAAQIAFQVGLLPEPHKLKGKLMLTFDGADIRGAVNKSAEITSNGVIVMPGNVATLQLGNLSSARPVSVTTWDLGAKADGSEKKRLGEPIVLPVDTSARYSK